MVALYLAVLCVWRDVLKHGGEHGLLMFLASNQRQARVAFRYVDHALRTVPLLAQQVTGRTADTISLKGGIDLEIRSASYRGLRGVTAIGAICDELGFWFSDELSRNPDSEILSAIRPSLATTGGPVVMVSSPYSRRGVLWEAYRDHYGPQGDPRILVAQGTSRDFNADPAAVGG